MFATLEIRTTELVLALWEGDNIPVTQTRAFASISELFNNQEQLAELAKDLTNWLTKPLEAIIWQEKVEENQEEDRLAEYMATALCRQWGGEIVTVPALWEEDLPELAQLSGLPEIVRLGVYDRVAHEAALQQVNQSAVVTGERFIVASLGQGVSVAAYANGELLDVNNSGDGDGPMGLQRAGTLPASDLVNWAYSSGKSYAEAEEMLASGAGWAAYQGVMKVEEWEDILAYQVVKEIGSMRAVLRGAVDAIVLTGELAEHGELIRKINERLSGDVEVVVLPGVDIALGLAAIWRQECIQSR